MQMKTIKIVDNKNNQRSIFELKHIFSELCVSDVKRVRDLGRVFDFLEKAGEVKKSIGEQKHWFSELFVKLHVAKKMSAVNKWKRFHGSAS